MPNFFICSLVSKEDETKFRFSFAGNDYQQRVTDAFPFEATFSFNVHTGPFSKKQNGNKNFYLYPASILLRVWYLFRFTQSVSRQIPYGSNVVFYNIDTRKVFIFSLLKLLRRKLKLFVIVADNTPPDKGWMPRFIRSCLQKADGLLALSRHLRINKNIVYQELLIADEPVPYTPATGSLTDRQILFSGTISKDMGIHIVTAAMPLLPDYELHITGNLFATTEEELLELVNGAVNIHYHGALPKKEYRHLLSRCNICLSLRDTHEPDHLYNFPSKIGEYLFYNKYVISSFSYPGFEAYLHKINWDAASLVEAILHPEPRQSAHDWLLERFGFQQFSQNLKSLFADA